jgi:hypothetical protein
MLSFDSQELVVWNGCFLFIYFVLSVIFVLLLGGLLSVRSYVSVFVGPTCSLFG